MQLGAFRKNTVHRNNCFFQTSPVLHLLKFAQCSCHLYAERFHRRPLKALHGSAASERSADIRTKGSDIGPLGAHNPHLHYRKLHGKNLQLINHHRSWLSLHFLSFPGQLIEFPAVDLQGGIHGRHLLILSEKAFACPAHFLFTDRYRTLRKHLSRGILGICLPAKQQFSYIFFCLIRQQFTELCSIAQTYRKNSGGRRIQCPRVTDFSLSADSPELCNNIVRSESGLLIYNHDTVHTACPYYFRLTTTLFFQLLCNM